MPRAARHDRQTALDRAVALFWERGYYATSLKQIEQALDMRPGSLYATFGSKAGLFSEALDVYAEVMSARLDRHIAAEATVLGGLRNHLRELAQACAAGTTPGEPSRACMIVKTLLEINDQDAALNRKANQMLDSVERHFAHVLIKARQQGELAPDTDCDRLARWLQAQVMGLRVFAQRRVPTGYVEALADDMAAILEQYAGRSSSMNGQVTG